MSIGITEVIVILVVVLVLFGGKRIPELARALGRASFEYKRAKETFKNEINELKETAENASVEEEKKEVKKQPVKKTKKTASKKTAKKTSKK